MKYKIIALAGAVLSAIIPLSLNASKPPQVQEETVELSFLETSTPNTIGNEVSLIFSESLFCYEQ